MILRVRIQSEPLNFRRHCRLDSGTVSHCLLIHTRASLFIKLIYLNREAKQPTVSVPEIQNI